MSKQLRYIIVFLFIVVIAAAQTANAQSISVELAEKTPPADPGDPTWQDPPNAPPPPSVPMDCGGYFACFCQVCCPDKPEPCYMRTQPPRCKQPSARAALQLQAMSCSNCPTASRTPATVSAMSLGCRLERSRDTVRDASYDRTYSDLAAVPSCFASKYGHVMSSITSALEPDDSKQQWTGWHCSLWHVFGMIWRGFLGDPQLTDATPWLRILPRHLLVHGRELSLGNTRCRHSDLRLRRSRQESHFTSLGRGRFFRRRHDGRSFLNRRSAAGGL